MGNRDRQESPESEVRARKVFPMLFERLVAFDAARDSVEVASDSQLHTDDVLTKPYATSNQVRFFLTIASDHLNLVRQQLTVADLVPPYALYSVMRSALEASGTGLWLLVHGRRKDRTERRIQLAWKHRLDAEAFAASLGASAPDTVEIVRTRLNEIRGRQKGLQHFNFEEAKLSSTTDMLLDVQRRMPGIKAMPILDAWRMCSAIAHANLNTALRIQDRRQLSEGGEFGNLYYVTASISNLAVVFESALVYSEALLSELVRQSLAPSRGKAAN